MPHALTLIGTRQKSWNVYKSDERNVEGVAEANETRALDGRIDVETAGQGIRLVSHNSDSFPVQAAKADDDVPGIVRHNLKELVVIHNLKVGKGSLRRAADKGKLTHS